jgi:hypothetical protein
MDTEFLQVPLAYSVHIGEKIAVSNEHLRDEIFANRAGSV